MESTKESHVIPISVPSSKRHERNVTSVLRSYCYEIWNPPEFKILPWKFDTECGDGQTDFPQQADIFLMREGNSISRKHRHFEGTKLKRMKSRKILNNKVI